MANELIDTSDAALALRWLARTRRSVLVVQVVIMLVAEAETDLHLHSVALFVALTVLGAIDIFEAAWIRLHEPGSRLVYLHGAIDLVGLTVILALSGGPANPLMSAYLVYVALIAVVLPPQRAWIVVGAAMFLQGLVVVELGRLHGNPAEALTPQHLLSHIVAFDFAAIAIAWVIGQLSASVRARDAEELSGQRRRAATDRLAALGTLTAGVAHELGTPLGTIQLLVEEQAPGPARTALISQVDRCRSILERLRANDDQGDATCVPDPSGWVSEWRRAAPDVQVEVIEERGLPRVSGAEANWRGAVWVALDNARRAGARQIHVSARVVGDLVELVVRDDGVGIDSTVIGHTGEPFRTGWAGTGLGLFVAHSFAQSVGGDVVLSAGVDRGALTTIHMPRRSA